MPVISRSDLESSPLADLHEIASEIGLDGFRRLRKADLVAAIIERQGGDDTPAEASTTDDEGDAKPVRRTRSRGGRGRARDSDSDRAPAAPDASAGGSGEEEEGTTDEDAGAPARPQRRRRGGRSDVSRSATSSDAPPADTRRAQSRDRGQGADERVAEGTIEVLGNGTGFVRLAPPEPSDDDVYVSAAQVRRCELSSGDVVTGPVRPPRRSERFPSLVRVDTINGSSADEVSEATRFEDLGAAWPTQRLALDGEDPTLKAIEWLTPLGRGSRAVIVGAPRSGKSEALRRVGAALAGQDGLEVSLVLTGARPEEIHEAQQGPVVPVAALSLAASPDAQAQAVERALDAAKRVAARGGDAVVLIDSLDQVAPVSARRAMAAARDVPDGGSLTVIATAAKPLGGETTVVALDQALTSTARFPALDLVASGTLRPELLVGEAGAEAIAKARADALG